MILSHTVYLRHTVGLQVMFVKCIYRCISYDWSWLLSLGVEWLLFCIFSFCRNTSPANQSLGLPCLFLIYLQKYCVLFTCSLPQWLIICSSPRSNHSPAWRSNVQGSTVCVCSEDGNDYHKRRKKDYVRNSLQISTFSKPSCFALQNHIMFCSSSVSVWCWSWACERLGSKSAMFTNTGGKSARDGRIQISLWFSKWLVIWPINRKHDFWLRKVFPALRALNSVTK